MLHARLSAQDENTLFDATETKPMMNFLSLFGIYARRQVATGAENLLCSRFAA